MKSPRARKTLSTHELARFLALLAETGNFALACDKLGRAASGLYKRRIRDAAFDCECVAALALFRLSARAQGSVCASKHELVSKRARKPADLAAGEDRRHGIHSRDGLPSNQSAPLKTTWNSVTLSTCAGRPQLRRAASGCLTRAGLDTFLKTLAATANVRFAAHSVGVAPSSIHRRRRRDPAFARDMAAAIDTALAALEMRVIEASGVFSEDDPLPHEGEGDSAELSGERGGTIATLTAAEALHFLTLHSRRRKTEGLS